MPCPIIPPPIVFVGDAHEAPPKDLVEKYLDNELIEHAEADPIYKNQILWSRLIIASAPYLSDPTHPPHQELIENFSMQLRLKGDWYRYCSIDFRHDWIAVALHMLPIAISLKWFDVLPETQEFRRLSFPAIFNHWIDRQENPELAFYQYWATKNCLKKREDPTIRAIIGDDDQLDVVGPSRTLHESLKFWTADRWMCVAQGPALATLLHEVRTPEKTINLLRPSHGAEPNGN